MELVVWVSAWVDKCVCDVVRRSTETNRSWTRCLCEQSTQLLSSTGLSESRWCQFCWRPGWCQNRESHRHLNTRVLTGSPSRQHNTDPSENNTINKILQLLQYPYNLPVPTSIPQNSNILTNFNEYREEGRTGEQVSAPSLEPETSATTLSRPLMCRCPEYKTAGTATTWSASDWGTAKNVKG